MVGRSLLRAQADWLALSICDAVRVRPRPACPLPTGGAGRRAPLHPKGILYEVVAAGGDRGRLDALTAGVYSMKQF